MFYFKHIIMNRKNNTVRFHHRLHLCILKRLIIVANILGLSTWLFLRIIFYDLPFVLLEELLIVLNIVAWSTGIAAAISFLIFAVDGLNYFIRHRKQVKFPTIVHVAESSIDKSSAA